MKTTLDIVSIARTGANIIVDAFLLLSQIRLVPITE